MRRPVGLGGSILFILRSASSCFSGKGWESEEPSSLSNVCADPVSLLGLPTPIPSVPTPLESGPSTTVIQHVYVPAPPPKKSHAGAIAAVVIIVLLLVFLFLIPVPTSFSRSVSTVNAFSVFSSDPSAYASYINITLSGSAVSGSFSVASGQPVAFYVVNGSGAQVFTLTTGSGTFSFTASSGPYTLAVSLLPRHGLHHRHRQPAAGIRPAPQ